MELKEYQKLAHRTECDQERSLARVMLDKPMTIRLMHAVIGFGGDLGELWDPEDDLNVVEEAGDLLWYLAEAFNALEAEMEILPTTPLYNGADEAYDRLVFLYGEWCTEVERYIYYGKEFDKEKALEKMVELVTVIDTLLKYEQTTLEDTMEANIEKLKKRFPDKFTEEAAAEENRDRKAEAEAMKSRVRWKDESKKPVLVAGKSDFVITKETPCFCRNCGTRVNDESIRKLLDGGPAKQCPECRKFLTLMDVRTNA